MSHIAHLEKTHGSLKGKKIFDLGSGRGKFLFACAEAGYDVVGLELNPEKIKATQAVAREKGVSVSVVQGKAERIPFEGNAFDFINASELIEHVEDPAQALREMHRVLRPGGTAYVSAHNQFGLYDTHFHVPFLSWIPRAWAEGYLWLLGKQKRYEGVVDRQRIGEMHYFTFHGFAWLARSAGFHVSDDRELKIERRYGGLWRALIGAFYRVALRPCMSTFHFYLAKRAAVPSAHGDLLYITNARIPTEKAHGLQIMKSCEAFAQCGMAVTLAVPFRFGTVGKDPFEHYAVKRLFPLKRLFSIDLFWIPFFPRRAAFYVHAAAFAAAALWYVARRAKGNAVLYSRDYVTLLFLSMAGFRPVAEIHDYRARRPKAAIRFILKKARKVIVNSEGTKALLLSHYLLPPEKLRVVPNGVDPAFFRIPETIEEAREKLGMPKKKMVIGFVGRLDTVGEEKGVGLLLSAFGALSRTKGDCILYVIGGPDHLICTYEAQAEGLGIPQGKIVFTGQVPYRTVPLYLKAIDVAVIPPPGPVHARTTSPMKVFEFLAAGKAIVASDLPALRVHLNERNAVFFDAESAEDLARKIQFIAEHPEEKNRLSAQAASDAEGVTWNSRTKKIIDFIESE